MNIAAFVMCTFVYTFPVITQPAYNAKQELVDCLLHYSLKPDHSIKKINTV